MTFFGGRVCKTFTKNACQYDGNFPLCYKNDECTTNYFLRSSLAEKIA